MMTLTDTLVELTSLDTLALPVNTLQMAKFSLFDWAICGQSGVQEPVATHLRALAEHEGGAPAASVFGAGKAPARMAALVNGATSHALDFDDTHFAHIGHLSVGIYPAALAVAEERGATLQEVITAFVLGAEAAIRVGLTLGAAHYNMGFHQTATAGAFGATVASARLMGLDAAQTRAALGLCATRASGVKSQFGTMGKPYNAGVAASNGVECARLAALGLSAPEDGLMGPQGFVPTHTPAIGEFPPLGQFLFDDVKYKFHACCHGTHAMIEALLAAQAQHGLTLDTVAGLHLRTNPRWLKVCNNPAPATGLEVKFSYKWLAGMVLAGHATGSERSYTDALAGDAALADFAQRVEVIGDDSVSDMQTLCRLTLTDGTVLEAAHDLDSHLPPDVIDAKLRDKAKALLGATPLTAILDAPQQLSAADLGAMIRAL
jgi:2-methylcitrate dehydratase PrpD